MSTCFHHPETEAVGFCRQCGKALCGDCKRDVQGMFYCEPCLAATLAGTAPAAAAPGPAPSATSDAPNPVLAACLSVVPGLGAIYNGEYVKAGTFIFIFASAITLADSNTWRGAGLFLGLFIPGFIF